MTRVYLETGRRWVFACAVDWPGWCRRATSEDEAIEALLAYAPRYRKVAGRDFEPGDLTVIGTVAGSATTEFGAPDAQGQWDTEPLTGDELRRQLDLLTKTWRYFDRVVDKAPATLAKGPRGGGRDRDQIVDHVREAERAYGRKVNVRVPPRTPWPEQREQLLAALAAADSAVTWPPRYGLRRITWHVLDHAWEIEDKSR